MPVLLLTIDHALAGSGRSQALVEIPDEYSGRTIDGLVAKYGQDLEIEPDDVVRTWKLVTKETAPSGTTAEWSLSDKGFVPWTPAPPPWREPQDDEYFRWMDHSWATDGALTFRKDGPRPTGWVSRRGGYVNPARIDLTELLQVFLGADPPLRRLVSRVGDRVPTRSLVYIDKSGVEVDIPFQVRPLIAVSAMFHGRFSESPVWFVDEATDDFIAVLLPSRRTP